jgi:hypothetical protein
MLKQRGGGVGVGMGVDGVGVGSEKINGRLGPSTKLKLMTIKSKGYRTGDCVMKDI